MEVLDTIYSLLILLDILFASRDILLRSLLFLTDQNIDGQILLHGAFGWFGVDKG